MNSLVLHRASWVVPVSDPVIADGAVVTNQNHIVAVGTFTDVKNKFPDPSVKDHGQCVLTPALVNTHIHIELSHIPIPSQKKEVLGFTDWINTLLSMRGELGDESEIAVKAARKTLLQQHKLGVVALGDIGNTDLASKLRSEFPGVMLHFNECLGRTSKTRRAILKRVAAAPQNKLFAAHAPYSTHAELIQKLKQRAVKLSHPFPIHVAEPSSENEMLCCGTGELHSFLKERGFIDDSYSPPVGIDNPGSVQYLHDLGVLDKQTICVHCIHINHNEVKILAETDAKICLCPGSNRYLKVGKAPTGLFLQHGLLPALGTDSKASNPELSLWREMNILHEDNPELDPADIFAMATIGGAIALGFDEYYGSLKPGKSPRFLAIPLEKNCTDVTMLYTLLVQNTNIHPSWVNDNE